MKTSEVRVGIVGATGYTGAELMRLLAHHPSARAVLATSTREAGTPVARLYPALAGVTGVPESYEALDVPAAKERCDGFFVCVPHGVAMDVVPQLMDDDHWVIDLSADFRLSDPAVYAEWYGLEHRAPGLLQEAVYGLPELFGKGLERARLVANPGCYPTATLLALAPAVSGGAIDPATAVISAMSGVSGAGREPSLVTSFSQCAESVGAYGVAGHRHTPEMEQALGRLAGKHLTLTFTPHLVPMVRGLLATCTAVLVADLAAPAAVALYREAYKEAPFVTVLDAGEMPATKDVQGSNACRIGVAVDPRAGRLVISAAIDNLIKGASGQAVQNMNILLGLDETTGLEAIGRVV